MQEGWVYLAANTVLYLTFLLLFRTGIKFTNHMKEEWNNIFHLPRGRAIMPRATVNTQETKRFDLKTLPAENGEDAGFVVLKRMSYGEFLRRRDMISKMSFEGQGKDTKATMEMAQEIVTRFEFNTCIVDHNLLDDNDNLIDFRSAKAFTVLSPVIGEEIAELIDEYNGFNKEAEEDLGN